MARQLPFRLILASGSSGRRELLEQAGYPFEVLPSHIEEPTEPPGGDIRSLVEHVAWLKAAAVAPRVAEGVVLAADTLAWIDGEVISKPVDEADARRILSQLSGRIHELLTGVCLWKRPGDWQLAWQEVSRVAFTALSDADLDRYLATRQWVGCSGAYAVQGENDPFVRVVEGSVSNVVGLPMESLERALAWITPIH